MPHRSTLPPSPERTSPGKALRRVIDRLRWALANWMARPSPRSVGLPAAIDIPHLGAFALAATGLAYERVILWCGKSTTMSFSHDERSSTEVIGQLCKSLLASSAETNKAVQTYIAEQLLPSINEERQAVGETALDTEKLASTLSLEAINLWPPNKYEFCHNDGDLIGGHFIVVCGDLTNGPTYLDTPG